MGAGEGVACPVGAGGCIVHTGRTLHYTGGNTTTAPRRAYIINCRPQVPPATPPPGRPWSTWSAPTSSTMGWLE